jgi:predicted phage tail protein
VLDDGSLYASAAKITGDITATSGNFNNVTIENSCIIKGALVGTTIAATALNDQYGGKIQFI